MPLPSQTKVLIVGAGPSGLALATCLAGHGVDFVLVDKLAAPLTTSRAAAIHARTLEVLDPLGVTGALVSAGRQLPAAVLQDGDRTLLRIGFEKLASRYQYILTLPQNETEAILTERLAGLGGNVEHGQEAVALAQDGEGVTVTLRDTSGGSSTVRAEYVVGADGYHSMVRQAARIGFAPGTYPETFILADVHMDWPLPADVLRLFLAADGMALVAPFNGDRFRIVATVAQAAEHPSQADVKAAEPPSQADVKAAEPPSQADVQAILDTRGPRSPGARVRNMVWSSRFRIHHGVAEHYRAGRAFLAGDAAHVHSPAGGQGMNTGIQDAVALGELLTAVLGGQRPASALDGYEARRRPVAQRVVAMTDQMTRAGTLTGSFSQWVRNFGLQAVGYLPPVQRRIARVMAELDG
jgi:2-polyprenyl-6-methoxyphenol hydroxylase-like FAD-dependent oxidoreductase